MVVQYFQKCITWIHVQTFANVDVIRYKLSKSNIDHKQNYLIVCYLNSLTTSLIICRLCNLCWVKKFEVYVT